MRLIKLEMEGFKSFANKTVVEFDQGITAIVGPNGSGKSNIIEAISWVLGEQSAKQLRGEKMADVIFAGSQNRQAVNMAQVTITFENKDRFLPLDFDEVEIKRRLHKDGTSEYFINQQLSRLKDIQDLFTDSGLGKESFSIISQGQIDKILNAKPEDRRLIFEEAAGVLKYKQKKKTAEQKLLETLDNLNRVQDIIFELEARIGPLKKQAEKAHIYQDKQGQLENLDQAVVAYDIQDLSQKKANLKGQEAKLTIQAELFEEKVKQLKETIEKQRVQLKNLDHERSLGHQEMLSLVEKKERSEADLQLLLERSKNKARQVEEIQSNIISYSQQEASLESQIKELRADFGQEKRKEKELNKDLSLLKKQKEGLAGDKETVLAQYRSDYIQAIQEQSSYQNDLNHYEKLLQQNAAQKKRLQEKYQQSQSDYEHRQASLKKAEEDLTSQQKDLEDRLDHHQDLSLKKANKEKQLSQILAEFNEVQRRLQEGQNRLKSLESIQANYSGYYQGVRQIMKAKDQVSGIIGPVAELVSLDERYAQAIDTALGSSAQHIVVQDQKSGQAAINYLKETGGGRATFLPLDVIRPRKLAGSLLDSLKDFPGFIGLASELVRVRDDLRPIIENLLGRSLIVENMDVARRLSRHLNQAYRIVTLDGDVINVGGSMSGGSRREGRGSSLLNQQNEVDQLKSLIKKSKQSLSLIEESKVELEKDLALIESELADLQKSGEAARFQEHSLKQEIASLSQETKRLSQEVIANQFELQQVLEEEGLNQKSLDEKEMSLTSLKEKIARIDSNMEEINKKWENRDQERLKLDQAIEKEKTSLQSIQLSLSSLAKEIDLKEEQLEEKTRQKNLAKENLQKLESGQHLRSQAELEADLKKVKEAEKRLKDKQAATESQYVQLNQEIQDHETKQLEESSLKEKNQDKLSQIKVKLSRIDVSLDHQLDYLLDEYQTSYEVAKTFIQPGKDYSEERKRVKKLKEEIQALGPVNLDSIEEYAEVSDRYDFLVKQQADLLEARDQLNDSMDQMDEEVSRRFLETFTAVQEQFSLVFPKMFAGGEAKLTLTDPDNLLETGVDIKAQPPGKKLQHLTLLSGGERALTAISLLFAIIQTKPIPFVILDEVEAALDDANVYRFSHYLRSFEEDQIQFIVITHRKGTMEEADSLYGVTMQEKGVSSLISVKLEEATALAETKGG